MEDWKVLEKLARVNSLPLKPLLTVYKDEMIITLTKINEIPNKIKLRLKTLNL